MSARDEILQRVRGATADVTTTPGSADRDPLVDSGAVDADGLTQFVEMVADYRAEVVRVPAEGLTAAIATALREHRCTSAVLPDGLDPAWVEAVAGVAEVRREAETTTHAQLDETDAVVTAAALGIAVTGTIVLDHRQDQGRRALTLVPDTHVCVVRADQVVRDVPDAVARLRPQPDDVRPLTWISGPSATSDIELQRVEGVHGPRTLVMLLVEG
ncbi:MAG: lactate utilization protein C [Janibacter sp.]|nr:lactate utilization protein C [Janibacter sp.]